MYENPQIKVTRAELAVLEAAVAKLSDSGKAPPVRLEKRERVDPVDMQGSLDLDGGGDAGALESGEKLDAGGDDAGQLQAAEIEGDRKLVVIREDGAVSGAEGCGAD